MNKIIIEYSSEAGKDMSKELIQALADVLHENDCECITFIHTRQKEKALDIPGFMARELGEVQA